MDTNQLLVVIEKGFADVRREMAEGFAEVRSEMAEGFAKIDKRFAKVDERFAKVEDEAHKTRILIEDLRDKLAWVDEAESQPLAKRVSALEVRVTKLEDKDKRRR
jgi:hypothetical protein